MNWSESVITRRVAILGATLLLPACKSPLPPEGEATVTVETILGDPHAHYGQTVTVTASVSRVLAPHGFTVRTLGNLGEMLILTDSGQLNRVSLSANDLVRARGVVREYDAAGIRRQAGQQFADGIAGYTGAAVLAASDVEVLPR